MDIPFCSKPLPEPDTDAKNIELHSLLRFFSNPAAHFLALRFGVRPGKLNAEPEENEPFSLDSLNNYNLKQELVRLSLEGKKDADLYAASRAASFLPPLTAGRFAFDNAAAEATAFANRVASHLGELLDPLTVSFQLGDFTVSGRVNGIRSDRHVRYRCANIKAKDRLSIWIEHLVLNIAAVAAYPRQSILVCRDTTLTLQPLHNAADILHDLIEIYVQGLSAPLPFFPESSYMMHAKSAAEAERCWAGSDFNNVRGECDDPAYNLCFGRQNPLNDEFRLLASRVYAPLLEAAEQHDL
jgi:exodeoxyribonuclease V gamma subunit